MKYFLAVIFLVCSLFCQAQEQALPTNNYQAEFDNAYTVYPLVPRGVLEAVSFTMTRFQHLEGLQESCTGIPQIYGVMGLTLDGKGYFHNNLEYISQVSGVSVNEVLTNPSQNILAFASAYNHQLTLLNPFKHQEQNVAHILTQLSELPNNNVKQDFALNSHLYSVLSFMNDVKMQETYNFPNPNFDLEKVFGAENLNILKSKKVFINNLHVEGEENKVYQQSNLSKKSTDYPPALENLTSCNFSSRGDTSATAVTVHTIQGTYAGAISWANNCSSNVSYHYVLRSSDGQVTQVVLESDKAWHVGSENPYTIGMEHEGFVSDSTWYTAAMYQSSADVVRDITQSGYGISPLRTAYFPWAPTTNYNSSGIPGSCVKIKGHQHYPNQTHTDPGANWDWDYYYKLINNSTPITIDNNFTGTVTDVGGSGNYQDDDRMLYLIQPTGATSITLNITSFDVESTWDYLYIYDGTTPFDDRVGFYTGTTIPPIITVNSGNVLLEFRSDCATTNPGFEISWSSIAPDTIKPTTIISAPPNPAIGNFTSNFTDADNVGGSGVKHQFYQVADTDGSEWRANESNGYLNDDFDLAIHPDWIDSSGVWSITSGYLTQTDEVNANTNIYTSCNQNGNSKYLYNYQMQISGSGANKRAGLHYMCDDASLSNRGNSYFVWFRQDNAKLQFYKVVNDTFNLEKEVPLTFNANEWYDVKIVYDKIIGKTEVWMNDEFISSWTDSSPITLGNQISLRSGNCIYDVENLQVYKNRTASELITVGSDSSDDIRYSGTPAGRINSIVIDSALNVSSLATEFVNIDLTTVVNELNSNNFSVYPNPTNKDIIVEFNDNQKRELRIVNIAGQTLIKQKNSSQKMTIDLIELPVGVYFLEVKTAKELKTIKLIKQ